MGALKCATRSGSENHAAARYRRRFSLASSWWRPEPRRRRRQARVVFNAMIDGLPALIVQCGGVADVREAVMFSREHNLRVSIRGGGHGVTGNAVCNDGLVIDLSRMRSVRADPVTQTARAEGGATWGDFDRETQAFGLASTGGIVPTTGIAGLTLGGGIGYSNRKWRCLRQPDFSRRRDRRRPHAEGERRRQCRSLLGASRRGGNFGVVTSLEYRVHPVGPVLGGELIFPLDRAKETLRFYRDWSLAAPDEVRADASLVSGPEGPALAIIVCYCGSIDDGERVLRPLRQFGPPVVDTVGPSPCARIQNLLTEVLAPGFCHYWKSGFFRSFSDDAIERLVDFFAADVPRRSQPWRSNTWGDRPGRRAGHRLQPSTRTAQLPRSEGMA